MALLVPTPGSTTQTKVVPGGKYEWQLQRTNAAPWIFCAPTSWEISMMRDWGEMDVITPFIEATYPSLNPKSVRRAITGDRFIRRNGIEGLFGPPPPSVELL